MLSKFQKAKEWLKDNNILGLPSDNGVVIPSSLEPREKDGEEVIQWEESDVVIKALTPLLPDNFVIELLPYDRRYKSPALIVKQFSDITEFAFSQLEEEAK